MTVHPPGPPPVLSEPTVPPVVDRRAPDRRSGELRRAEDRTQAVRVAIVAATSICGGLAILFAFFWALGAVPIEDALVSTFGAIVLAGLWIAGFYYRQQVESEKGIRYERERRGF
jgi:hypothetical protein